MHMLRSILKILPIFICFFTLGITETEAVNIAFVEDGQSEQFPSAIKVMKKEIAHLLAAEFEIKFVENSSFTGNWTPESVMKALQLAIDDPDVDIVVTVGVLSSQMVKKFFPLQKPVFSTYVINYVMQELPFVENRSGVDNFNYLTLPANILRDYKIFREIVSHDNLAFLIDDVIVETVPGIVDQAVEFGEELGITVDIVPVGKSAAEALANIPKRSEAVYIVSLTQLSTKERKGLFQGLINLDLPSFSYFGKEDVELGVLGSMSPESDLPRLSRRLALNIQRYLLGDNLSDMNVIIEGGANLTLNQATIWELGIDISWNLLNQAELVGPSEEEFQEQINLIEAVEEGLRQNVDLAAAKQELYIGIEEVRKAYSVLFPQVDLFTRARFIDLPRASISGGSEPQREIRGAIGASQIIYSNERFGRVRVEKWLQKARIEEYQSQRVILIFEIAKAFLNTLRASTLESIQRNNLRLTRSNLNVAEERVAVGEANYSEVYRWESEIANNRATLAVAHFDVLETKLILNRLLNRPVRCPIYLEDLAKKEEFIALKPEWFEENITSHGKLERLMSFATAEGIRLSPQLAQIQDQVYAQAEVLGIAKRAFYAPEIAFNSEFTERWWEDGVGSRGLAHIGGKDWFMGLEVRFPLMTGGRKSANQRQAWHELRQLVYQRQAVIEDIETNIRRNLYEASTSSSVLIYTLQAAGTAKKNLELVQRSYTKGRSTIIDLLDAQNQELITQLEATNAVYDYLIDILGAQRDMGQYGFLMSKEERDDWINRLDDALTNTENEDDQCRAY